MKRFALLFTFVACGFAQTLTMTCPASVKGGATLTVPVTLAGSGGGIAGFQLTATTIPAFGPLTAAATGTASAVSKGAYVSPTGNSVVVGGFGPPGTLNAGFIANGTVLNLNWAIPATLPGQTTTIQINLAGGAIPLTGTDANGGVIGIGAGPLCTVAVSGSTVTNFCDLNGDGKVDQSDVTAQVSLLFAVPQTPKCARDATGCGVTALEIVANAALGKACTATQ